MTIQLNPTQHAVLTHATQNTLGKITWFPDNVKGGARQKEKWLSEFRQRFKRNFRA